MIESNTRIKRMCLLISKSVCVVESIIQVVKHRQEKRAVIVEAVHVTELADCSLPTNILETARETPNALALG